MSNEYNITQEGDTFENATISGLLKQNDKYDEAAEQEVQKSTRIGIYRQFILTIIVASVMVSLGHSLAFPALIVPQLRNQNDTLYLDSDAASWYTSVFSLASPFGSMMCGFMMDRFGRKITLATPLIPLIGVWVIVSITQSVPMLFISRIMLGVLGGFGPPICQIYLAECGDSDFRGVTINAGYVSLSAGFLLTFAFGTVMNWRYLALTGISFPIITLIGLLIIPDTPIWLIRRGYVEKAYKSLYWLRGNSNIARNELNANLSRVNQEQEIAENSGISTSCRDFFQPSVLKPIVIIFSFILFFNLTGTYLIIYYAIDILSQVNLVVTAQHASVILSVVRLIVTVGFCWLFMRVKRRSIYLIAGIGSTVSTLSLAAYLYKPDLIANDSAKLWAAGSLLLVFVATNTGYMIAPGFLTGELLPSKIRGRLAGYIYTYFSIVTFLLNKIFPSLNAHIGLAGIMLVFGIASLATALLIYFMVPETKGKSLLEIELYFQTHGWIYKPNRLPESSTNSE